MFMAYAAFGYSALVPCKHPTRSYAFFSPDEVQATVGGDDAKPMQLKLTSYLPQLSVFLHALLLQWTLAFAITLTFCLDWFMVRLMSDHVFVLMCYEAALLKTHGASYSSSLRFPV